MTRAAFIVNPTKVTDPAAFRKRIETFMSRADWTPPLWLETTVEDPGVGMCAQAVEAGCAVVYVCGGDGTVMAAATALSGTDVPLAIVPLGTGNLFARNLDLPLDDPDAALRIGLGDATRQIDVGAIEGKRFVVMAGLGFDAAVMRDAPEKLKKTVGWPAYVVSGAKHLRGRRISVTITIDDGQPIKRRVRTVLVGNVGRLQGGLVLLPDAQPDDGVLDVAVLAPGNALDWVRLIGRVVRRADVPDRRLERFGCKHIVIEATHPQPRQLDGDLMEDGMIMDIQIEAAALAVRVAMSNRDSDL
jgi:YegS/Rv2252/BmrU family lipid kinase